VRRGGYPTRDAARRALSQLIMPVPGGRDAAPALVHHDRVAVDVQYG
jgi:hypothetical protein